LSSSSLASASASSLVSSSTRCALSAFVVLALLPFYELEAKVTDCEFRSTI